MADDETPQPSPDPEPSEPEPLPTDVDPRLESWFERGLKQDSIEER